MRTTLTNEQRQSAIEVMRAYLAAPGYSNEQTVLEVQSERDRKRLDLIKTALMPLLLRYLNGEMSLAAFKSEVDGINKRYEYWGFKGIKGQMFFNMMVNVAEDVKELDTELREAIKVPSDEETAAKRIKAFSGYVKRLGEHFVQGGGGLQGRPKTGSVPFFLSYFWQIQNPKIWPVYYTNSVQVMTDLNLWRPTDDLATNYLAFKQLHEELAAVFSKEAGKPFGLYEVEHVFWFKGGNPYGGDRPIGKSDSADARPRGHHGTSSEIPLERLPESYVPPVVQIMSRLARNDESLTQAAKASATTVARAFEKSVHTALTILGYETKLLGQGQGRVPDGLAFDSQHSYAIIWDAKGRGDHYSMGTDDRTIREYIVTQSRELKKRGLRNVYYMIVSSRFADDFDDPIRSLKMETDISEVLLIEADALVAMVDTKLRLQVSLGPDGMQRLFTNSGVLTVDHVRELMS